MDQTNEQKSLQEDTLSLRDKYVHPVQAILAKAGIETNGFPVLRIAMKIRKMDVKMNPLYLAITHEIDRGESFESLIRVVRIVDSITETSEREYLINIEWVFNLEPIRTDYLHPAFGLVSSEVTCPTCRNQFKCQPHVMNAKTIRIDCPVCSHSWCVTAHEENRQLRTPSLFTDLRERRDSTIQMISKWSSPTCTSAHSKYDAYFPFEFEPPIDPTVPVWISQPSAENQTIENLLISFSNQIALHSLNLPPSRNEEDKTNVENIESTKKDSSKVVEIERPKKSDKQNRKPALFTLLITFLFASISAFAYFSRDKDDIQNPHLEPQISTIQKIEIAEIPAIPSRVNSNAVEEQLIPLQENKLLVAKHTPKPLVDSIKRQPDSAEASNENTLYRLFKTFEIHLKLKHYADAVETIKELIKRNPELTELNKQLGIALFLNDDFEKSAKAFATYLKSYPNDPEKKDIQDFIQSAENHKSLPGPSEQVLGERWSSFVQKSIVQPSNPSPRE